MTLRRYIYRARASVVVGGLAIALGLAACGSSSSSTSKGASANAASTQSSPAASGAASATPFKVLGFYATSGPAALSGAEEFAGLEAAASVINSEGGILGHKVVIKDVNDQGAGTPAVSLAEQELASGAKYNLIVPGISGADAIPLASIFAHTSVLQVTPAAEKVLDQPSKYPNLFMTLNDFPANEQAVATQLKAKGITEAAFITGDDSSGQDAERSFVAAAKAVGITVTATVLVPDTAVDAKPQVQQALATNPQALVTGAFSTALPAILAARSVLAPTLPYYLDSFAGAFPLQLALKQAVQRKGIVVEQFPYLVKGSSAQQTPWFQTFSAAYGKLVPHPVLNLIAGVVSYNALMVTRAAAVKAGSIDGPAMAKALEQISSAGQVRDFVGDPTTGIFSPTTHQLAVKPSNYGFYNAGPTMGGVFVPGA